jgi:mono/diheme cytochrome c family protein
MTLKVSAARWKVMVAVPALVAMAAFGVKASGATEPPQAKPDMVKRGEYLVNAMGCNDCHTPMKMGANGPEYDTARYLSGHQATEKLPPPPAPTGPWMVTVSISGTAWSGPWGISYTQNITPDPETGIGNYTEAQFIQTIRDGKKQGRGRDILPPMPWPAFKNLTDDDLKSIYAFLRTVKPLKNKVPDPVIAPPK